MLADSTRVDSFGRTAKDDVISRVERGFLPGFEEDRVATFGDFKGSDHRIDWPSLASDGALLRGGWVDVAVFLARRCIGQGLGSGLPKPPRGTPMFAVLTPSDARDGLWESRGQFKQVNSGWECFDAKYYLCVRELGLEGKNKFVARVMRRLY